MSPPRHPPESLSEPRIAGRYAIVGELGRGGMALVCRVADPVRGQEVALKQLLIGKEASYYAEACERFEREFHILSELSHPRIIQVYDYGVDGKGPFYTMELLEGSDLREQSPLPWRRASALAYDVCSSLGLLHSRRLVHCDISPRNVRCTADGRAKLIDFGAMVPMGRSNIIVGTPAFTAPEMVARSELDGATDLFSLGATLYYALTGRAAFNARDFDELLAAWRLPPPPPSTLVPEIPEALDRLVLSLLSLEPAGRPRSAFEVMQRLAAIAGLDQSASLHTGAAYLTTPRLIGREQLLREIDQHLVLSLAGETRTLLVRGATGAGRSRVLDASAITAKLRGASVLRADAAAEGDFSVVQVLLQQLVESCPQAFAAAERVAVQQTLFERRSARGESLQLRDLTRSELPRATLQEAVLAWLLAVSESEPLALAVDDLQGVDTPSAGLLAQLASRRGERHRLCLLLTLQTGDEAPLSTEIEVLARHAHGFELAPLQESETMALLSSVFGEAPNVSVVGRGVHAVAAGNPKLCMELARHLVATGGVQYTDGGWSLPSRLGPNDLPVSADTALRARVAALSPLARQLLVAQALASHEVFTREDYAQLSPGESAQHIDHALLELVARELLSANGRVYRLQHRSWAHILTAHMSDEERRERHAALATLYAGGLRSVFHLFAAEREEQGLDLLLGVFRGLGGRTDIIAALDIKAWELGQLFQRALPVAERPQRSPRDVYDLLLWLVNFGVVSDESHYFRAAARLLPQLRDASGLADWLRLAHVADPTARLTQALQNAFERHTTLPELQRVARPDEAIRHLATFVATSIPIAARTSNLALLDSLPDLVEPLVPLSAAVAVIHEAACATRELCVFGRLERALELYLKIHARLDADGGQQLQFLDVIRGGVIAAIASIEVQLGLHSAASWAERIEADSFQAVQSLELRRVLALQRGDRDAAEKFRERSEHVALQSRVRPMFANMLLIELETYAATDDLTGTKNVRKRIEAAAARATQLRAACLLAEATDARVCGQLEAALPVFEECLRACEPLPGDRTRPVQVWPIAMGLYLLTLVELDRAEQARALGTAALNLCRERGIEGTAHGVVHALALAHAKLGTYMLAAQQLEARIELLLTRGVTGLFLGVGYEARARVAIWAGDENCFEQFARLTAKAYRHGEGSMLGSRFERLLAEARARFPHRSTVLEFAVLPASTRLRIPRHLTGSVVRLLQAATTGEQRAAVALTLLCEDRGATSGVLYLVYGAGLEQAAVHGEGAPYSLAHARGYLSMQLDAAEYETRLGADDASDGPLTTPHGMQLVVLGCALESGIEYIGLAALRVDGQHGGTLGRNDPHLPPAIAKQLVATGDVRAFTPEDAEPGESGARSG